MLPSLKLVHHGGPPCTSYEASPMAAPHLHVADRPACEMISQVKVWSKEPLWFGETMKNMK